MRFLSLVLVLCGISFGRTCYDWSTMKYICSDSVQKYDGSLVPNPDQFQTTTIVELSSEERQVRAVEQSAESVKTIANIMTGFVIVTIVLVVISVAQNI